MGAPSSGGNFYHVSDDSWQVGTVKWGNAPAADTTLVASLSAVSVNAWYEVDITSLITGDGTSSLRISDSSGDAELFLKRGSKPAATGYNAGRNTQLARQFAKLSYFGMETRNEH